MNLAQGAKTLFLIDPHDANRKALHEMLADDYHVVECTCANDGIFVLEQEYRSVCAVLLSSDDSPDDLQAFLDRVRDSVELATIPILLLVTERTSEDILQTLGHEVVDCIAKPYHPIVVKNRIANAISAKDSLTLQKIEHILRELPSNIYMKDRLGRYVFATHYWHHLDQGGEENWTIRGKTDLEIRKDKENALRAMQSDQQLLETKVGTHYTIEVNTDGVQEFLEIIKEPLLDADGNVEGIIALINDVTEHELLKKKLEIQARTDELTHVYNRTFFYEYLRTLPEKDVYPVSIISADCDNLKTINDTYGHVVGDSYIQMAAHLFCTVLPEGTAVFRLGGDEFTALLPSTPKDVAEEYLQKMRDSLKKYYIRDRQLSISFGLSALLGKEDSVEMRMAESDHDMYRDKRVRHGLADNMANNDCASLD